MSYIEAEYSIETKTAFFIGSGMGIAGGVDRACLKDSSGLVYFPGSSVKGKLRDACRQLMQLPFININNSICQTVRLPSICKGEPVCIICKLFGSSYTSGRLRFHDAVLSDEFHPLLVAGLAAQRNFSPQYNTSVRHNNKVNRLTQTVEHGHLFSTEVAEKDLLFRGRIEGDVEGVVLEKVPSELAIVRAGLILINSLGGQQSRGLGSCSISLTSITIDNGKYDLAELQPEFEILWNAITSGEAL